MPTGSGPAGELGGSGSALGLKHPDAWYVTAMCLVRGRNVGIRELVLRKGT